MYKPAAALPAPERDRLEHIVRTYRIDPASRLVVEGHGAEMYRVKPDLYSLPTGVPDITQPVLIEQTHYLVRTLGAFGPEGDYYAFKTLAQARRAFGLALHVSWCLIADEAAMLSIHAARMNSQSIPVLPAIYQRIDDLSTSCDTLAKAIVHQVTERGLVMIQADLEAVKA